MRKTGIITFVIIAACLVAFNSYASEGSLSEAEKVAQTYMTAFFQGNYELSFSLMDQEVLQENKNLMKKAYESSIKDGTSEQFVKQFYGINDFDELLKLPPKEFFITLTEKNNQRGNVEQLEAMKKSVVKVTRSTFMEDNKAKVTLEITMPKPDGNTFTQEGGLTLSYKNEKWFVVGN